MSRQDPVLPNDAPLVDGPALHAPVIAADLDPALGARDLERPLYGASLGAAITRYFRKYAVFSGRASRSEYWWMQLAIAVLGLIPAAILTAGLVPAIAWVAANPTITPMGYVDGKEVTVSTSPGLFEAPSASLIIAGVILAVIFWLALLVPSLALTWRRLHDVNLSGAFWALNLIPYLGALAVLILTLLTPKEAGRRFDRPRAQAPTQQNTQPVDGLG